MQIELLIIVVSYDSWYLTITLFMKNNANIQSLSNKYQRRRMNIFRTIFVKTKLFFPICVRILKNTFRKGEMQLWEA